MNEFILLLYRVSAKDDIFRPLSASVNFKQAALTSKRKGACDFVTSPTSLFSDYPATVVRPSLPLNLGACN